MNDPKDKYDYVQKKFIRLTVNSQNRIKYGDVMSKKMINGRFLLCMCKRSTI